MKPQKKSLVAKNTLVLYTKMLLTILISLYTTRIILKNLGITDFGIYNIMGGSIALLLFFKATLSTTSQRFMSYHFNRNDIEIQKKIFTASTILHLSISVIIVAFLEIAALFLFDGFLEIPAERAEAAQKVYHFMVASTALSVITVPYESVLNAHENMTIYAVLGVLESLLKLLAALFLNTYLGDKLVTYGILMAAITTVNLLIIRLYCHIKYKECRVSLKRNYSRELLQEMKSFAVWNFFSSFSSIVSQNGQSILLNKFGGPALNAAQGVAGQISAQLMNFSEVLVKALNPGITKSVGSDDRELAITRALRGCKFGFSMMAIVSIPAILEMDSILQMWLDNVPEWAAVFCILQVARNLLGFATRPLQTLVNAGGNIKNFTRESAVWYIAPLPVSYLVLKLGYPVYSIFLVWIFFWSILNGYTKLKYAKLYFGLEKSRFIREVMLPGCIIFSISFITGKLFRSNIDESFFRIAIVTIVSASTYISLFSIFILSEVEKRRFYSLIKAKSFAK
jgi:O-antigen/teichoic acid export membrane protein